MANPRISIGFEFRAPFQDCNPKWVITRKVRKGVYEAVGAADEPDCSGQKRTFTIEAIRQHARQDQMWAQIGESNDSFFEGLQLGAIIHYNNGFENFVRCEVVAHEGKKQLKPMALVGKWSASDLPQRGHDGSIYEPYHAKAIRTGNVWQPSETCVYEAPAYRKGGLDPRALPAIDLSVPELSSEEQAAAQLWQAIKGVNEVVSNPSGKDPKAVLLAARALIDSAISN
jgi:hypothetical protein